MNGGDKVKKFVGFTSNGEYSVGCTGQTVYLYDKGEVKRIDIVTQFSLIIPKGGRE